MGIEQGTDTALDASPPQRPGMFDQVLGWFTRVDADDEVSSYRVSGELGPHHDAVRVPVPDGDLLDIIREGHAAVQAKVEAAQPTEMAPGSDQ